MRAIGFLLAGCIVVGVVGCNGGAKEGPDPLEERVDLLTSQNEELADELAASKAASEQLTKQLATMAGLPDKVGADELYPLETVKLTRYTDFYDKDDDGAREVLIVYVQPVDTDGDVVKAAGAVDVELWDLGAEAAEAKLGAWHTSPKQLRKLWFSTFMRTNYRLILPIGDTVKKFDKPLTVKMSFTDHLTGKVFQAQHVIEPESK